MSKWNERAHTFTLQTNIRCIRTQAHLVYQHWINNRGAGFCRAHTFSTSVNQDESKQSELNFESSRIRLTIFSVADLTWYNVDTKFTHRQWFKHKKVSFYYNYCYWTNCNFNCISKYFQWIYGFIHVWYLHSAGKSSRRCLCNFKLPKSIAKSSTKYEWNVRKIAPNPPLVAYIHFFKLFAAFFAIRYTKRILHSTRWWIHDEFDALYNYCTSKGI